MAWPRSAARRQRATGIEPHGWRATARATALLTVGGYILFQSPVPNLGVLLAPFPRSLPIVDSSIGETSLVAAALGLTTSTAVLAFIAGYFQFRLNATLISGRDAVPEGPGARPVPPRRAPAADL